MQKPKNLLPGLFLCVFSRIPEPLVDFYCSNFWIFLFLFGADFFCRKERYCRPLLYRPFLYRPILHADSTKNPATPPQKARQKIPREPVAPLNAHLEIPIQKARRARRAFTNMRLYLARTAPQKAQRKNPEREPRPTKRPHAKTPGVIPGVWLMKSSFNLRLTHCGRFLAGCTGPACSRRPQ